MDPTIDNILIRLDELVGKSFAAIKNLTFHRRGFFQNVIRAFQTVDTVARGVVLAVEQISAEVGGLSAPQKRKAAIDYINRKLDIPVVPEFVEGWVIGYAIDQAVKFYNRLYGHAWAQTLLTTAEATIDFVADIFADPE